MKSKNNKKFRTKRNKKSIKRNITKKNNKRNRNNKGRKRRTTKKNVRVMWGGDNHDKIKMHQLIKRKCYKNIQILI